MKLVVIESPFGSNPDGTRADAATVARNVRYLHACIRDSLARGESPYASHGFFPQVLNDADSAERKLGMEAGFAWGAKGDLVAVYMDLGVTPGMKAGIERAAVSVEERYLEEKEAALSLVLSPLSTEDKPLLLCVYNKRYGGWGLPGGRKEWGETIEEAQRRELDEETGLSVVKAKLAFKGPHGLAQLPGRASVVSIFNVHSSGRRDGFEEEPGCPVRWLALGELISHSPFAEFYARVLPRLVVEAMRDGWHRPNGPTSRESK